MQIYRPIFLHRRSNKINFKQSINRTDHHIKITQAGNFFLAQLSSMALPRILLDKEVSRSIICLQLAILQIYTVQTRIFQLPKCLTCLLDIPAVFLNRCFLKQDIMWEHLEFLKVPQIWFCPNSMVGHQISPPIPTHNSVGSQIFLVVRTCHLVGPQIFLRFPTTLQISKVLLI